jgi:hypothetical protein
MQCGFGRVEWAVVVCELLEWRGLCYCQLTVGMAMSRQVHGQGTTNRMDQITTTGNSAWQHQSELLEPLGWPRCASPAFMPRSCTVSINNQQLTITRTGDSDKTCDSDKTVQRCDMTFKM